MSPTPGSFTAPGSVRVATLFPNEASALRLVTAILCEIDREWQVGRAYLTMNP